MSARELKPCGTEAAYQRHRRHGEKPCDACREAHTEEARRRKGFKPRRPARCGTNAGYMRHRVREEVTCRPCCDAHAAYQREWSQRKRSAR